MIVKICDAVEKRCVTGDGNCVTTGCMAWEFWLPPPALRMEEKTPHHIGVRDRDKLGYCGLVHRRI